MSPSDSTPPLPRHSPPCWDAPTLTLSRELVNEVANWLVQSLDPATTMLGYQADGRHYVSVSNEGQMRRLYLKVDS